MTFLDILKLKRKNKLYGSSFPFQMHLFSPESLKNHYCNMADSEPPILVASFKHMEDGYFGLVETLD